MIPEIYENFRLLEYWWEQRRIIRENWNNGLYERWDSCFLYGGRMMFWNDYQHIQMQIDALNQANNEIAKEHGNSYKDEKGKMVWIPSKLAQK